MARQGRGARGGQRGKGTINVSFSMTPSAKEIAGRSEEMRLKLRDFRPVWNALIPRLRQHMGDVWTSQGSAAGEKWPAWKRSYAKRRPNGAIGVLTGKLLGQLTSNGVLSRTKGSLRFGAKGPGVRAFHFGYGTGRKGSHARPYVVATPGVVEMAAQEWERYIQDVAKEWPTKTSGKGRAAEMIKGKT